LAFDTSAVIAGGIVPERPKKTRVLRVLIADETREFRKFVRRHLEVEGDIDVVGEALSGTDLVPLARQLQPDVVLVDIALSGMAGLDGTRRIKAEMPSTTVIFLSVLDEGALREAAARYGADDFLTKDEPISGILAHIRRRTSRAAASRSRSY
jgi:DNA-binding NarL/FixJ family response regulator